MFHEKLTNPCRKRKTEGVTIGASEIKKMRNREVTTLKIQRSVRKSWIFILVLILVAAVGIVFAYKAGQKKADEKSNGVVVDQDASDWDQDLDSLSGQQDKGIKIPGYGELSVEAGDKNWKITLANPKDNDCYFKYSITIGEDETPIYESDYIEPGKAIREFQVNKALDAGDYTIYMNISTYSMDGKNTRLNGASVKADLHVVN